MDDDCYTCRQTAAGAANLPPRELIAEDEHWRVAHAFGSALAGWLVLLPRRHVTAVSELTGDEAAGLGSWQVRLSRALAEVTGCAKTYVAQFAEKEGFARVHFHIVPRGPELAEELRGPRVFGLLGAEGERAVGAAEMDALALRLRTALRR
ncbi:HIT family protein [Kitasatospora sp. NPDC059571]|uniref:HIT family protein n=1 Tax=Kitasatospora sp. NPDC059571 TaxID=3346871 RepID=UPI0036B86D72